jgi:hypothetical protein
MAETRRVPGHPQFEWVDNDHVAAIVDGEREVFSRDDVFSAEPGSGLAYFGPVRGDWRMIQTIEEDVSSAFEFIDRANGRG